jgi:hypothetical protein
VAAQESKDAFLDAYLKICIVFIVVPMLSFTDLLDLIEYRNLGHSLYLFVRGFQVTIGLLVLIWSIIALFYFKDKKFRKATLVAPWVIVGYAILQVLASVILTVATGGGLTVTTSPWGGFGVQLLLMVPWTFLLFHSIWLRKQLKFSAPISKQGSLATWKVAGLVIVMAIAMTVMQVTELTKVGASWMELTGSLLLVALIGVAFWLSLRTLKQLRTTTPKKQVR